MAGEGGEMNINLREGRQMRYQKLVTVTVSKMYYMNAAIKMVDTPGQFLRIIVLSFYVQK